MPPKQNNKAKNDAAQADNANDIQDVTAGVAGLVVGGSGGADLAALPAVIIKRLSGIEALQKEYDALHEKHLEELAALEEKYIALYNPLFLKRKDIVLGAVDPAVEAPAEAGAGASDGTPAPASDAPAASTTEAGSVTAAPPAPEAVAAPPPPGAPAAPPASAAVTASPAAPAVVGVPGFWLQAIKNHPDLQDLVTPADEEALSALLDVSFVYMPGMTGFKLVFTFAPNPFFEDEELTKEYALESMLRGEPSLLNIEAPEVHWKPNKNLTIKKVKKKSKRGKPVFKEVKQDSFFNFFSDPSDQEIEGGEDAEDEDEENDVYGKIHADFSQGLVFKDQLIPNAYKWFTGEGEDGDDDYDFEEGDDEDEDDDEEEEDEDKPKKGGKKKGGDDDDDDEEDDEEDDEGNADVAKSLNAAFATGNKPAGEADKPQDCKTQ